MRTVMSDAFLPVVSASCCWGMIACLRDRRFGLLDERSQSLHKSVECPPPRSRQSPRTDRPRSWPTRYRRRSGLLVAASGFWLVYDHAPMVLKFLVSASLAQEAQRFLGGSQIQPLIASPTTSAFPVAAHAAVKRHMFAARFS
jgi:hypothetical protein